MYYEIIGHNGYPRVGYASVILKELGLDNGANTYKFVFNVVLSSDEMFEAAKWCEENINDIWLIGSTHSGFNIKLDAMAFKLRWT